MNEELLAKLISDSESRVVDRVQRLEDRIELKLDEHERAIDDLRESRRRLGLFGGGGAAAGAAIIQVLHWITAMAIVFVLVGCASTPRPVSPPPAGLFVQCDTSARIGIVSISTRIRCAFSLIPLVKPECSALVTDGELRSD